MTDPLSGPDLTARRRDRVVAALERLDGVVAANVEFDRHGSVERVRVAAMPGVSEQHLRQRLHARLHEVDVTIADQTLLVAWMGATPQAREPGGASRPESATQPPADRSPAIGAAGFAEGAATATARASVAPAAAPAAAAAAPPMGSAAARTEHEPAPPPPWHGRFLVLDGVDVDRRDGRVACTVRLTRLGEAFSCTVEEIDSPAGRARSAARATLRAAERAGEGVGLALEGVVIHDFFGRQYVAVFVEATANRRFASLSGILAVDQSLEHAACLAILRAVERWVAW